MAQNRLLPRLRFRRSTAEALVWLAVAVVAFALTFQFDGPLPTYKLGAAFWPRIVIAGVMIAAGVLLVTSLLPGAGDGSPVVDERMTDALPEDAAHVTKKTIAIFVLPMIYVYAIHKFGFLLVTPVFLPAYMLVLGVRSWRALLGVTAGLYAALILIFVKLIYTPLPQGAGFFHSLNGQLIGLFQ